MAKALNDPARVHSPDELRAAHRLVELVQSRQVVLPVSGGHMLETATWPADERRYRLGLTIFQLAAGWHIRDPVDVRRLEMRLACAEQFATGRGSMPAVVTLSASAAHGQHNGVPLYRAPNDLDEPARQLLDGLVPFQALVSAVLDDEHVPQINHLGWVNKMQQFTDWLAGEPQENAHLRHQRIDLLLRDDIGTELAEEAFNAGISPADFTVWLHDHADASFRRMPSLGLYFESAREKVLNPGTRWKQNDLVDLMYLSCAAGYADFVVGERSAIAQLRRASARLGRTLELHSHLSDLVVALDERLHALEPGGGASQADLASG